MSVRQRAGDRSRHVDPRPGLLPAAAMSLLPDGLERSLEFAASGILVWDARAEGLPLVYVNSAFERLTGQARENVLGQGPGFLPQTAGAQPGLLELRESLRLRRECRVPLHFDSRAGPPRWCELVVSPVPDGGDGISHFVGMLNDITERRCYESELVFTIHHDALTSLPNRTLLEDRLRQACQIAHRYGKRVAVLFIDLDGFKPVNDSLGHSAGDAMLVEVARRLLQTVRPDDTVARLGGDEFLVLLANLDSEEPVLAVVERLVQALARSYRLDGTVVHITASIGIAMGDGGLEQPEQLIRQADLAMYKAKQAGRNNFQWFSDGLDHKVSERLARRTELRRAIEQGEMELHYLPEIDGRSGRVVGIEALLRWRHPERGYVPPTDLIAAAEDAGQLIPLGRWVLDTACRFNRRLAEQGLAEVVVSVNVPTVHFRRSDFLEMIQVVLAGSGLPPARLELEVTEAVLQEDVEQALASLRTLKEIGVRVAIDDFGTGFSSLSHLKRLPIDKVKVDSSFIRNIISDRHDANITQGIIAMAHHLHLEVAAEGVETEAQYFFLRKIQCDTFQGFYFSRPLPADQMEAFLRERRPMPREDQAGGARQTLLLLDDEQNILRALARLLRRDGYEILMASRAQEAFDILARNEVQVIITDQRMPEMCGTEFLSQVKGLYPDTVRIVLSGYTDLSTVTEAINQGEVYKFLLKPWDDDQLRSVVAEAFRHAQG